MGDTCPLAVTGERAPPVQQTPEIPASVVETERYAACSYQGTPALAPATGEEFVRKSRPTVAFVCGVAILSFCSAVAEAQGRRAAPRPSGRQAVARPAGRAPVAQRGRRVQTRGYGYRGYRYGFYDPYFYGPYGYPYYGQGYYYDLGSVRLQVKPEDTEVYVDGYYVGVVDEYDGVFQRLRLPSGEHEIELYLDGYESVRETLYLVPGETYKLPREMKPLAEGAPQLPRPEPLDPPERAVGPFDQGGPAGGPFGRGGQAAVSRPASERFGSLTVRVQPADAEVLIDGERWLGFEGRDRLVVELGAGPHSIEVRREGYRTYRTEVEVRERDNTSLNVSLPPTEGDIR